MRPSDSPASFGLGSGSPCLRPTSVWVSFLTRSPACTHRRWGVRDSHLAGSRGPCCPRNTSGPPRLLGRPLRACQIRTPRPGPLRLTLLASLRLRLRPSRWLGHLEMTISGLNASAHTLACLRIACAVIATGARLATDLRGYALVGSVSHRLDDVLDFRGSSCFPFPPGQHCLVAPALCFLFCSPFPGVPLSNLLTL